MGIREKRAGPAVVAEIGNGVIRLHIRRDGNRLLQEFAVRRRGTWLPVLAGAGCLSPRPGSGRNGDIAMSDGAEVSELNHSHVETSPDESILLRAARGAARFETRISLLSAPPGFHVVVRAELPAGSEVEFVQSQYAFLPALADPESVPEFVWVPHLRFRPDYVIAEHVFRSPAAILQEKALLAALVPDLDLIGLSPNPRSALDLQLHSRGERPFLAYGLKNSQPDGHVFFRHSPIMTAPVGREPLTYGHFLLVSGDAPPRLGYRRVVRFLWDRYGARYVGDCRPQMIPLDRYARYGYDHAFKRAKLWLDVKLGDAPMGGTTSRYNEGTEEKDNQIWYQGWLNNVRTAYGLGWYGRKWKDEELSFRAASIIRLATHLPQVEGVFPAICIPGDPVQWKAGTRGWEVLDDTYSVTDNAWTCYWLLKWHKDIKKTPRAVEFCERFARLLVAVQSRRGAFPSWIEAVPGRVHAIPDLADDATTAVGTMFLAELCTVRPRNEFVQSLMRAVRFLVEEIVPERRWWDYEALYSPCTRRYMGVQDPYTALFRQSNLCIFWTAATLHALFHLTGQRKYLEIGEQVLDYLCLFQQVWKAPFISVYSFGGFGVLNTDAEWNDNRSTMFAPLFLDYFADTGRAEYFHRGVAALRAGYALMYVPENQPVSGVLEQGKLTPADYGLQYEHYGHAGVDAPIYGHVLFDWGAGSTASAAAGIEARYGGLYVDARREMAFGIDGCSVKSCSADRSRVCLQVSTLSGHPGTLLKVAHLAGSREVVINGRRSGRFSARSLEQGVPVHF